MQGKLSNADNFGSQECKQKTKSSHSGKIREQKNKIKNYWLRGWDREESSQRTLRRSHVPSTIRFSSNLSSIQV